MYIIIFLQEKLNSGNDKSDIGDGEFFESENIIVCQYYKVNLMIDLFKLKILINQVYYFVYKYYFKLIF